MSGERRGPLDPACTRSLPAHLVLVGLPGAGKSTVGRSVAEQLGVGFLDFDTELERRAGMSVGRLFAERGEAHFRELERALTAELRGEVGMVLAPGGGWAATPGNVALLSPPARIIFLAAEVETLVRRLGAARADRPLLATADPATALRRLLAEREAAYRQSDWVVDTEALDLQQVTDSVVALATGVWGG